MARNWVETDNDAPHAPTVAGSPPYYCSGLTATSEGAHNRDLEDTFPAGSSEVTLTVDVDTGAPQIAMQFSSEAVGETSWAAGTWGINIDITSGNASLILDTIVVCRLNSSDVSQATVGQLLGIGQMMGAGQSLHNITGAAQGSTGVGDKFVVLIAITNTSTKKALTVGITPSLLITTPLTALPSGRRRLMIVS